MPRYLKKYNPDLQKNEEQEGEGAILNLAVKALSHLIPGLLAKFGESAGARVGDEVGKLVQDKIIQMRGKKEIKNKEIETPKLEGGAMNDKDSEYSLILNKRTKGKNNGPISSYEVNPEIIPSVAPKKGKGFKLAGIQSPIIPSCKPCEKKGEGFEVAGKKGGGSKIAGGGVKKRGRPRKNQNGSGVVMMTGRGIAVHGPLIDKNNHLDKINDIIKSKNGEKANKGNIEKVFNQSLMLIMDNLGVGETNTTQLNNLGKFLFKEKFGGAVPSDMLPKDTKNLYYIVNTDTSEEMGTHWMAVADNLLYDSFGRNSEELGEYIKDRKLITKNNNRNQSYSESNCGQRSMSFLVCHALFGNNVAKYL